MKEYLRSEFHRMNLPKYYHYFEEWFLKLTDNQLDYFKIDMIKNEILQKTSR